MRVESLGTGSVPSQKRPQTAPSPLPPGEDTGEGAIHRPGRGPSPDPESADTLT